MSSVSPSSNFVRRLPEDERQKRRRRCVTEYEQGPPTHYSYNKMENGSQAFLLIGRTIVYRADVDLEIDTTRSRSHVVCRITLYISGLFRGRDASEINNDDQTTTLN